MCIDCEKLYNYHDIIFRIIDSTKRHMYSSLPHLTHTREFHIGGIFRGVKISRIGQK